MFERLTKFLKIHIVTDSVSQRRDCCAVKDKIFEIIPGS